jgi:MFS family permease
MPLKVHPLFSSESSAITAGISIVYEFTDAENRPTYIGLANTAPGIVVAIAPLISGWLAGAMSYQTMFIISTLIGAVSWVLLRFAVREPRFYGRTNFA